MNFKKLAQLLLSFRINFMPQEHLFRVFRTLHPKELADKLND